jgi:hypothetical protein
MHTLSGRRFEIGTEFAPTIEDIAVSLARLPRWGGATVKGKDWCVLHHSVAAGILAGDLPAEAQLYALVHDMEEMATGDIPKPFKAAQQSELGDRLRLWLYKQTLGVPHPGEHVTAIVKVIDNRLKFAELIAFCHPNSWWDPYFRAAVVEFVTGITPDPDTMRAVDAVWQVADTDETTLIELYSKTVSQLVEVMKSAT